MKHFFLRSSVALACLLGLASCGGDDRGDIVVPVFITGINKGGLTLKLNDHPEHEITSSGTYYFPELLPVDSNYTVTQKGRPSNVAQDCVLSNPSGKVSTISPNNITLACVISTFELGGTITGLRQPGLILINGSDEKTFSVPEPAGSAFSFTMTTTAADGTVKGKVAEGSPYGVLIFKQPTPQVCTVAPKSGSSESSGNGTMPAGPVSSIQIVCN